MKDFRQIHDDMIVIDGCCPLLGWGVDTADRFLTPQDLAMMST